MIETFPNSRTGLRGLPRILLVIISLFLLVPRAVHSEQRFVLNVEKYKYASSKSGCSALCEQNNDLDVNVYMRQGWRVVSVIPNKELVVEQWKSKVAEREKYADALRSIIAACEQDPFCRTSTGNARNKSELQDIEMNISFEPAHGCTCIGTQYLIEK